MNTELFSNYITQFKKKYNVRARPLFLNGLLEEITRGATSTIVLFQVLPDDVISDNDIKALSINANNKDISKVYVFSNAPQTYEHEKVRYIKNKSVFGLRYSDVFAQFDTNTINVVLFDSIALDYESTKNLKNLASNQIGLLSPRTFSDIPEDVERFNVFSQANKNACFEFGGIVFNGKMTIGSDLYIRMIGCTNILVSLLVAKFSIINLSQISLSYLFDTHPLGEDNYISDNFPIIYSLPQLYFNEDLDVSVPEIVAFETFNNETVDCLFYTPPILAPEEEYDICEVKRIMLQKAYREYKDIYTRKSNIIDDALRDYQKSETKTFELNLEKLKTDKLSELSTYIEERKASNEVELEEHRRSKSLTISEYYSQKLVANDTELQAIKAENLAQIQEECRQKLNLELENVRQIITDTENAAHIAFQRDLEAYTKKMYQTANQDVENYKIKLKEDAEAEINKLKDSLIQERELENEENKVRLKQVLDDYEKCKKSEMVDRFQTEYFLKYNVIIGEIESRAQLIEIEKKEEIDREVQVYKTNMIEEINKKDVVKRKVVAEKLAVYEKQQLSKIDEHLKEIERIKMLDIEIKANTALQTTREAKLKEIQQECMDYEKQLKLNAEMASQDYMNSLTIEINSKAEEYKIEQTTLLKRTIDEEYARYSAEQIAQQKTHILEVCNETEVSKQAEIMSNYKEKLKELDYDYASRKAGYDQEVALYKESLMKTVHANIKEYRIAALAKVEALKEVKLSEMTFHNEIIARRLEDSRNQEHAKKLKEITEELEKEKETINIRIDDEYKIKLVQKNKESEREAITAYGNILSEHIAKHEMEVQAIENKYRDLIVEYQIRHQAERTKILNEFETERITLQREVIENHNASLLKMEEEYEQTRIRYSDMMKKTFNAERQQMIETERQKIEESLTDYRRQLIEKDREQILREKTRASSDLADELSSLRKTRMSNIEREISSIREEKLRFIDVELKHYREKNEEQINKEFSTLVRGLKEIQ